MAFSLNTINAALSDSNQPRSGVDFTGKSLKLDSEKDAQPIVDAINKTPELHYLTLTGNTLGVNAAQAIAKALETHPEFSIARWSDMFTGRMKTEIPPALSALGDGMITSGARLTVLDLSDNAFGPIGVEGLARLLESEVCSQLQELRLNNNGLGITGGKLLAKALSVRPPRLRVFIAGRNRLENEGAKALAGVFELMGSLQEIAMPQNGIYHVGITALSEAFKMNPSLHSLNLNDNTVGPKGALAIANALPVLKNLKHINFGDCLLKSKGAEALAKAFKDNELTLETLDLSHNEIGRAACRQVAESVASTDRAKGKLAKVTLAGNSLGGPEGREAIRGALGDAAALSDGEASEEEYVTGSEEDSEEENEEEDSATEDDQHQEESQQSVDTTLDDSGARETTNDAARFLENPSLKNLRSLGAHAADVLDAHLQSISDPSSRVQAYAEAALKVSGLSRDPFALNASGRMLAICTGRAGEAHAMQWVLANSMLVGLGLIKSENKAHKITWDLPAAYTALGTVIDESFFPRSLADTLRFFVQSKKDYLERTYGIDVNTVLKGNVHSFVE